MKILESLLITMQPSRWWRCAVILLPVFFSGGTLNALTLLKMVVAFTVFSLLTGAINIIDDIADIEADKKDLLKRAKPLPSGELSVNKAEFSVAMILTGCFVSAFFFGPLFGASVVGYFVAELSYFLFFKKFAVIDALFIAAEAGMLLTAGSVASGKALSPWLFVFTTAVSVLMVFCENKRRLALSPGDPGLSKKYDGRDLDQMINISAPLALIIYFLYCLLSPDGMRFNLVFTAPFAMYAVYRMIMLSYDKASDKGLEKALIKDRAFILVIALLALLLLVLTNIF